MRGSKLKLQVYEENKATRRLLYQSMALYNVCAATIYYLNGKATIVSFILRSVPEAIALYFLVSLSRPVVTTEDSVMTLVDPGRPLSGKGVVAVAFDFLFMSMVVKLLTLYSARFWLLFFLVALSAGYELLYKPLSSIKRNE
jgi:hypothetical protein